MTSPLWPANAAKTGISCFHQGTVGADLKGAADLAQPPAPILSRTKGVIDGPVERFEEPELTFESMVMNARRMSLFLDQLGVSKTERVILICRSGRAAVEVLLGLWGVGAIVVPVNPSYQDEELRHVLVDSGAKLVVEVVEGGVPSAAAARVTKATGITHTYASDLIIRSQEAEISGDRALKWHPIAEEDLALLIYTSGTTGRSKGCAHSVGGLRRGTLALMEAWGINADDVVIHALPLFHVHGLCVALLGAMLTGAETRFLDRFEPAAVVAAARTGGTVLMAVPTMIHRLLTHLKANPQDGAVLGKLRLVTCGSAPLAADQLAAFRDATGLTILERYGMSETLITLSNSLDGPRIPGAVGRPIAGVETKVVDDELWVRCEGMMQGYWQRPEADAEVFVAAADGGQRWFRTGDAVNVDDDGTVRIIGRLSQDIMKVGGFKLSTREIEEALLMLPGVAEVAVVGVPDPEWGERVCAMVVPSTSTPPTLEDLQAVTLAAVKKPRALVIAEALPRNALGKVMKPEVRKAFH